MCDSECLMCYWVCQQRERENKYRMFVLVFDSFNRDHTLFSTFNLLHWSFSPLLLFRPLHHSLSLPLMTSSSPLSLLSLPLNTFPGSPNIKPQMGFCQYLPKYHIHPSIIYTVYPAKGCGGAGASLSCNPARGVLHLGQIASLSQS